MVFLTFFIYENSNKYTNMTVSFFSLINPNIRSKYSFVELIEIQNIKSATSIILNNKLCAAKPQYFKKENNLSFLCEKFLVGENEHNTLCAKKQDNLFSPLTSTNEPMVVGVVLPAVAG